MKIVKNGQEFVQCEMCEAFATFDHAAVLGWDWFTGHLHATEHYCRKHKDSEFRNHRFADSGCRERPVSGFHRSQR